MSRQRRVLVVDDLEKWRELLIETLQREGFYANSASTVAEVFQRLEETFYHVLVLDIRLIDTEPANEEGIELLGELDRRGLIAATQVIILSAYGTPERMRLAFKDYRVADFLSKDEFTKRAFLESVQQAFSEQAPINLSLEIHWQQVNGPEKEVGTRTGGFALPPVPSGRKCPGASYDRRTERDRSTLGAAVLCQRRWAGSGPQVW